MSAAETYWTVPATLGLDQGGERPPFVALCQKLNAAMSQLTELSGRRGATLVLQPILVRFMSKTFRVIGTSFSLSGDVDEDDNVRFWADVWLKLAARLAWDFQHSTETLNKYAVLTLKRQMEWTRERALYCVSPTTPRLSAALPSMRVHGLEVNGVLGHGTFGVVLEVIDCRNQAFAIKLYRNAARAKASSTLQYLMELELRLLGKTHHLPFVQSGIALPLKLNTSWLPCGALMPSAACTLSHAVFHDGFAWSLKDRAFLARQLSAGLASLHDLGFAHRDLKPDNVLLYLIEGRVAHLTISDFSAAIKCAVGESLTVFPNHIGGASVEGDRTTIDYCCPEMVGTKSNEVYATDPASMDVWSLGAVLAVVGLRGEPFILGSDPQRTLRDIALRIGPPPPEFRNLASVVMLCTESNDKLVAQFQDAITNSLGTTLAHVVLRGLLRWTSNRRLTARAAATAIAAAYALSASKEDSAAAAFHTPTRGRGQRRRRRSNESSDESGNGSDGSDGSHGSHGSRNKEDAFATRKRRCRRLWSTPPPRPVLN